MKRNKIISSAKVLSRIVKWLCYLFFGLFTVVVIHWHIAPDTYYQLEVTDGFKAGYGVNAFQWHPSSTITGKPSLQLSELPTAMIYWLYLRAVIFFAITLLIIREIDYILKSVASLKTFYDQNEEHFRKIARWALIGFILSCFNFSYLDTGFQLDFKLVFPPLLLSIGSLVLAEIFSEGKELSEDQRMIV